MTPFEAAMWRAEVDPELIMTTMMIEELDSVPDWDRFLAAMRWALEIVPRFRQKVVEAPFGLGAPQWSDDPLFDLRYHVRRQRIPEGGGWHEALEAMAQLSMSPLDRNRPPWEAVLFDGLPDGRAIFYLKMHHSTTDGMGLIQLLDRLHSDRREHNPDKPHPPVTPLHSLTSWDALRNMVRDDVASVPGLLRGVAKGASELLADPVGSVRSAVDYAGSLYRVLAPCEASGSPVLARRSNSWRLALLDVRLAELKAAAKSVGGTLNDAYLAALFGGFRRYHEALGEDTVDAIPTTVPVSLRTDKDQGGGNKIATIQIPGPVATVDAAKRIGEVAKIVRAARDEPAVDVIGLLSPVMARLPAPVIAQLSGSLAKSNDLQASNVPGLQRESYLAGSRIERTYGFGPLPGCAAMIAMVTYDGVCNVGINIDTRSIADPDLFLRCLQEGFAEVLALGPESSTPVLRS
ncbi:wax ester/triacylglycerol synthase family O-acyltransferase [Actinomycetospora sp. TBRC 11914]|uniref:wax ester/triacylglycerol synthase family O-acyltransferase n=1 Tax=Actinomycetospora sp. TBRC 11914 TaxID=2729387 RepID=UPI00145E8A86|nr:wax ester/triacylglycerol synthase family O-acyltransferase [Actinomycetospora sp. TBRC 11914]NMO91570.1 wax ester/triacylglycerol synthase family O-acyltransferase [Actinomycetospora sp. TBRC 11914]